MFTTCDKCQVHTQCDWRPNSLAYELPSWEPYYVLCGGCMHEGLAELNTRRGVKADKKRTPLRDLGRALTNFVDKAVRG